MFDAFINSDSNIFLLIGALIVGFVLIIFGGDKFVDSAIWMAVKTKIPQMLIGATLVSIGTTLPELFTSYTAAAQGQSAMAVGNALGSIMCNTSLILAITLAANPSPVGRRQFVPKFAILAVTVVMLFIFALSGEVNVWQSAVLTAVCAGYFAYNIISAVRQSKQPAGGVLTEDSAQSASDSKDEYAEYHKKKTWVMILFFVLGAAGIAVGAQLMVASVSGICAKAGVSEGVISLTVVALGTSLPELVTALTSLKKNSAEISMGNILGANILNATLITGGSGLIAGGLKVSADDMLSVIVTVAAIMALLILIGVPVIAKKKTYRFQGITMLGIYAAYVGFLVYRLIVTKA